MTRRNWLGFVLFIGVTFLYPRAADPQAFGGTDAQLQLYDLPDVPPEDSHADELFETNVLLKHRAIAMIRAEFEEKTWRAFWRAVVDEHETAEIADELEMSCAAVRQAKCRVLRRLRQELEDLA